MRLIAAIIAAALVAPAHAALEREGASQYAFDASTGLAWLDLGFTARYGYRQIERDARPDGYAAAGWRLATETEVTELFRANVPSFTADGGWHATTLADFGAAMSFSVKASSIECCGFYGVYGDPLPDFDTGRRGHRIASLALIEGPSWVPDSERWNYRVSIGDRTLADRYKSGLSPFTYIGSFLVQDWHAGKAIPDVVPLPIPEPGTYALMFAGLGVVGAVVRRRRR